MLTGTTGSGKGKQMRKIILGISAAVLGISAVAYAQDAGSDTPDTETADSDAPEAAPKGAVVTRTTTTENGDPVLDENGEQVLDESGQPVFEQTETGFEQTVETPSGIVHTITKADGGRAVVTHDRSGKEAIERPERAEKPEKAERPEKPERPERPEKPEKPERPEKPEKPGRP